MDLRIIHNTPYVILLTLASFLFNVALQLPTPITMAATWFFEYYFFFWFFQKYVPKEQELSWMHAIKKRGIWVLLIFLGGIIGHRMFYGHVTPLVCIVYTLMITWTFALLEHSLYSYKDEH